MAGVAKPLVGMMAAGVCSYYVTGKTHQPQPFHECFTCGFIMPEGCCSACARKCHIDHKLSEQKWSNGFYCDCGAGVRGKCISAPAPAPAPAEVIEAAPRVTSVSRDGTPVLCPQVFPFILKQKTNYLVVFYMLSARFSILK